MSLIDTVNEPDARHLRKGVVISVAGAGIPVSSSGSPMRRGPRPS